MQVGRSNVFVQIFFIILKSSLDMFDQLSNISIHQEKPS